MREIPGFYYDEEKKKYFKITKDHLQSKNKKPCSSPKSQASVSKNEKEIKRRKVQCNLQGEIFKRSLFGMQSSLERASTKAIIGSLKLRSNHLVVPGYPGINNDKENNCFFAKFSSNGRRLAVSGKNRFNICEVFVARNKFLLHHLEQSSHNSTLSSKNFNTFHWKPHGDTTDFVYTSTYEKRLRPGFFYNKSVLTINLDGISRCTKFDGVVLNCCAWSKETSNKIVVGTASKEFKPFLIGGDGGPLTTIHKYRVKDQPKVIEPFSDAPCFIVGMKSGDMCIIDDRSKTVVGHPRLSDYCIDCVKFHVQDLNYVTFSNWGGRISTVDLRMRKTIANYQGHCNNSYDLEFHLGHRERFLYAVGSDNILRAWDIKTQELFYQEDQLPICGELSRIQESDFPSVLSFTEHWSNDDSLFGMLCLNQNSRAMFVRGL